LQVVLFLFQLEMDSQLQRALTYENFDAAREVRARRQQVDSALRELQEIKGPGCGARVAGRSDAVEYAPQIMTLKAQMAEAAAAEKYDEAATLRDRLREVEAAAAEAADAAAQYLCPVEEPRFSLGEMVLHSSKGYRGVVCGWDLACCESEEWQAAAGINALQQGTEQVFYHVLVDARDWPPGGDHPPVAYVAEELLTAGSSVDFASESPLDGSFEHPYSYLLFLGADGQGNMVPCRQLRDKYCVERRDVYSAGESRWEEDEDEDEGGDGGNGRGPGSGDDSPAGQRRIPGIDMSSLD
jgi:hemimethylated DNA binding protein